MVSTLTAGQARRSSTASLSTFRYHFLFSYIIIYIIPTCFIPTVICSYRICDVMKYLYFVTYLSSLSLCNFLGIEFVLLQVALPIKSISLYFPTKIHTELSITWPILGESAKNNIKYRHFLYSVCHCFTPLCVLQRYYWYKRNTVIWSEIRPFPIDIDYMVQEAIETLRPTLHLCESYDEAAEAADQLDTQFRAKLGELYFGFCSFSS